MTTDNTHEKKNTSQSNHPGIVRIDKITFFNDANRNDKLTIAIVSGQVASNNPNL